MATSPPADPVLFLKPSTSVIGPGDAIALPALSNEVHYEGELAVVIGGIVRRVPVERALDVVFGYTCANDVTARDLQRADGQWARAKGFDTFCPLGPWIETELDPSNLAIECRVDGELRQSGSTSDLLRGVAELIAFASAVMTLLPGDVLLTGTPAGVGPIRAGNRVDVTIEGIGTLSNPVVDRDLTPLAAAYGCGSARLPTGNPHVGLIRTALFNWAYARHTGGTFVFRIEDTDAARDTEESYGQLLDGAALARPRLGRGSRGRRPLRALPAVGAHGHLRRRGAGCSRPGTRTSRSPRRRRSRSAGARAARTPSWATTTPTVT